MDFEKELERIAQEYRDEGYAVVTHPDKDHLPGFAADFGVDLLATRGAEKVLVQVKKNRSELEADPRIPKQAEITSSHSRWRYDLVLLEEDSPILRTARRTGEPTAEQIEQMLREAEMVLSVGSSRAAFLLAWAGLEAAMRRYAQRSGLEGKIGSSSGTLLRELYASGRISPDQFHLLEAARQIRTGVVHGLAPIVFDQLVVMQVLQAARDFLNRSETLQPVAG